VYSLADIEPEKVYNDRTMKSQDAGGIYKRTLEITWLAVIFLIPLFFNPESHRIFVLNKASLLQFLVIAMLALWLAEWLISPAGHRRLSWRNFLTSPLHVSIIVFGLLAVISTAASITPAISFWGSYFRDAGLLNLTCWILFFLIVAQQIRNRAQLLRAVYTLLLSSAIVSLAGIIQYYAPDIISAILPNPVAGRVSSTIGNPLFLSSFLAMVIPFSLALIIYSWNERKEGKKVITLIGLVILLALQFWCLWLAQYSITILLYAISLIIFVIIWGIVTRKKLVIGLGAASLLTLATIASVLVVPLLFKGPLTGIETQQELEPSPISEEVGLYTLGERVQYWRSAVDIFVRSPEVPFSNDRLHFLRKVIGYGPETFTITFQLLFPDQLKSDFTNRALLVDRPHNDYLYLATTMGLLGLLSFLSILAVFFYLCSGYLRRATTDIDKLFLIAMVAAMIQYMADIFFNLSTISPELVFWLILAMTCITGRFIQNEEPLVVELKEAPKTESSAISSTSRTRFVVSLVCAIALIVIGLVIAIRPFLADIYLEKGLKLQKAGSGQAIYAFDQATKINPEEVAYWHSLGAYSYYVAQHVEGQLFKMKVLAMAAEAQYKAAELRHFVAYEYYSLADICTGWAWSGTSDKWTVAMSFYDKASQLFPDNAVILDKWSLALIIKGDLVEARDKLNYAESCDPKWAQTSFLSGLLLTKEGKNAEAALKLTQPIRDKPSNLIYFIDLCDSLKVYDMVSPLGDSLGIYIEENPDDWSAHALLGITSLFSDNLDIGINEFNTAMMLASSNDVADLFRAILKLTNMSSKFKAGLPGVAVEWRDKLNESPERDTLLPALDQLGVNPK
jgi:O-antigen ligase/tetratricopeptide (TPR) repeat protein